MSVEPDRLMLGRRMSVRNCDGRHRRGGCGDGAAGVHSFRIKRILLEEWGGWGLGTVC